MKILYVTNMYPSAEHIHDGIFIKEQIEYNEKKHNIEVRVFLVDGLKSVFNYFKSIFAVNLLLAREKFDLIHIHFGLSGIFLLFNPFLRIPVVVTLHGSDIQSYKRDGLIQKLTRLVVGKATKVIVLNENMARILSAHQAKLVTIPCGIDVEAFCRKRNNLANRNFLLGFPASRSRTVKNFGLFQRIVTQLKKSGYNIDIIEFDGLTREQMADQISRLDCLVLTSFSEGSPQIVKEAIVSGVPVVSTNVGDVKCLLNGLENCYVIEGFYPEPFVEKIKELIKLEPMKRTTEGKNRIKMLQLDQETVCSKVYYLYTQLIGAKASQ